MPESPPPGVVADAFVPAEQALKADAVAAVLADFQSWLIGSAESTTDNEVRSAAPAAADMIDLHTLLAQFLAVRHEVNLQTRALRAQQVQNAETLEQLSAALGALQQSQERVEQFQQQAEENVARPLLKTLIDLYDALALASREMQRMQETVCPALEQFTSATAEEELPAAVPPSRSFWARLFRWSALDVSAENERRQRQSRACLVRESSERVRQLLASVVTGYTMSLQRVERALRQHGLEAIPAVGQRFDPERMEVVEAVVDSGRSSGEVIEELRRGYLWQGRVFRYAQVRVAKS
jgi:molecular chaperone GrpE